MRTVAALFVAREGVYFGAPGVECWDQTRDARTYAGPYPVVAHPPCSAWCQLAGIIESRYGHRVGDDGGCFAAALDAVRTFGGVLEHPAYSKAWRVFDLPRPPPLGWQRGLCGGWVTQVEQGRYGHAARKATWLYAFGQRELPALAWFDGVPSKGLALVSFCKNRIAPDARARCTKRNASRTPVEFRDLLLSIARAAALAHELAA